MKNFHYFRDKKILKILSKFFFDKEEDKFQSLKIENEALQ